MKEIPSSIEQTVGVHFGFVIINDAIHIIGALEHQHDILLCSCMTKNGDKFMILNQ